MIEYAVSLKIGKTKDLVLISTITKNFDNAKENLVHFESDIKAGKYFDPETGKTIDSSTSIKLVMREVTPWCEITTINGSQRNDSY